jgi:hypothetical protein
MSPNCFYVTASNPHLSMPSQLPSRWTNLLANSRCGPNPPAHHLPDGTWGTTKPCKNPSFSMTPNPPPRTTLTTSTATGSHFSTPILRSSIIISPRHGYSLNHWKDIINVIILKEPGNTKVHRLRVIHIFEADYNLIRSLKWLALSKHAEDRNLLKDGQYGSRAGRETPALPYLEELKTEIAYGSCKPLVNMDNDASSCYNRIIGSLASLISQKYGQNRRVVLVNAKNTQGSTIPLKNRITSIGRSVLPLYRISTSRHRARKRQLADDMVLYQQ